MSEYFILGGVRCLRLEVVAQWYQVEVSFLLEAVELDLLPCESSGIDDVLLPEHSLDRLAQLLRWHWQTGLDLTALALVMPASS